MEITKEIEILIKDRCTKSEAEKHLKNGSIIFDDFEENFDSYMKEWNCNEDEKESYKKMTETKKPISDWGIVEMEGRVFYIMYALI